MLKSIKTALKLSEIREKLNALNAVTDPTDAQKTEERDLIASQKTSEVGVPRSAAQAEDDARTTPTAADAETRETAAAGLTRECRGDLCARRRASVNRGRRIRVTGGATSCAQSGPDRSLARARRGTGAVTPAPANVGASEQPVLMPVFARVTPRFLAWIRSRSRWRRGVSGSGRIARPWAVRFRRQYRGHRNHRIAFRRRWSSRNGCRRRSRTSASTRRDSTMG